MNWKSAFKTIAHAAVGGLGAGLVAIPAGGPITVGTTLIPGLISAATSAFSALSDSTQVDPTVHAIIGGALPLAVGLLTGDVKHDDIHGFLQTVLPSLLSGLTSGVSSKMDVK